MIKMKILGIPSMGPLVDVGDYSLQERVAYYKYVQINKLTGNAADIETFVRLCFAGDFAVFIAKMNSVVLLELSETAKAIDVSLTKAYGCSFDEGSILTILKETWV